MIYLSQLRTNLVPNVLHEDFTGDIGSRLGMIHSLPMLNQFQDFSNQKTNFKLNVTIK